MNGIGQCMTTRPWPWKMALDESPPPPRKLIKDLRVLTRFVALYCRFRHAGSAKAPVNFKFADVPALAGGRLSLCTACNKLLAHALVKRLRCPLDPKPACKRCPQHCYAPPYRAQIREVMRFSGRKLVLSGRLHYLVRLFS
jgi:hypothetical protein